MLVLVYWTGVKHVLGLHLDVVTLEAADTEPGPSHYIEVNIKAVSLLQNADVRSKPELLDRL